MYEYTRVLCIVNVNNIYCDDENVAFVLHSFREEFKANTLLPNQINLRNLYKKPKHHSYITYNKYDLSPLN